MRRNPRLLATIAVGDAYGAGFEMAPPDVVERENDGRHYRRGAHVAPGHYTDDTQMSLALTESVLCGEPWEPRYLADRFVACFHRDPRPGYAEGFEGLLRSCRNGTELLARINPDSDRNGAAMRALPLGLLASPTRIKRYAAIQARITHDTPGGIASAQAAALMGHYALYGRGPLEKLPTWLEAQVPGFAWSAPWKGRVPVHGVSTVRAAVTALTAHRSLEDLLRACVAFTGDTDSVAAIAAGAAACSDQYDLTLAPALRRDLENGPYGRSYLTTLDTRLNALLPRRPAGRDAWDNLAVGPTGLAIQATG